MLDKHKKLLQPKKDSKSPQLVKTNSTILFSLLGVLGDIIPRDIDAIGLYIKIVSHFGPSSILAIFWLATSLMFVALFFMLTDALCGAL